jgi:integrase
MFSFCCSSVLSFLFKCSVFGVHFFPKYAQTGSSRNETVPLKKYSLRDIANETDLTMEDAEYICQGLKKRGLLRDYILPETKKAIPFSEYLLNFWDWDKSEYIREKLRKSHGIHRRYTIEMLNNVRRYWVPYFKDKMMGDITRKDINNMMNHLEMIVEKAESEIERLKKDNPDSRITIRCPKSPKHKNKILKSSFIPLRYAFRTGELDNDPTSGVIMFSGSSKKRHILTPELAKAVFKTDWNDPRAKCANMLAAITGMRMGEIQAIKVKDLGTDCIYVSHSWNSKDGLKTTKNNEPRRVEVPFPEVIQALCDLAKRNPHGTSLESFVFWAGIYSTKPMEGEVFLRDLRRALLKIGMSKESTTEYCFHSWRHFFTSYMKGKVDDKVLQSMTGHKTAEMLDLYSNHELSDDRVKLQIAQKTAFAGLLPMEGV